MKKVKQKTFQEDTWYFPEEVYILSEEMRLLYFEKFDYPEHTMYWCRLSFTVEVTTKIIEDDTKGKS